MNKFDKQHLIYERQFFQRLVKFFRETAKNINLGLLTLENAEVLIASTFGREVLEKILFNNQLSIGNSYGKKVGNGLNKAFGKNGFKYPLFSEKFQTDLINYYDEFGGEKIKLLNETYTKSVVSEIKKATELNETVSQMQRRIELAVNKPNFYKYQALRIARTETTFAMNSAKQVTGEVSGYIMEKVWSAKRDGRERPEHGAVDKVAVPQNGLFTVGGELMAFPSDGANGASAGNIVNCRCGYGYRGKRAADGKLIYVDI